MTKKKNSILESFSEKSVIKQQVFTNTFNTFKMLKSVLKDLVIEYNNELGVENNNPIVKYKNRGKFQASFRFGGEIFIFSMHTNVYEFDRSHNIWKTQYAKKGNHCTYSGIINIYNFLSDSFKYSRSQDLGYLVGRIFINNKNHYFVEGKRQMGYLYKDFGTNVIDKQALREVIEASLQYVLEFDLLVPQYDKIKIITVGHVQERNQNAMIKTGKRLGFQFNSDDVQGEEAIYTGH